MAVSSVPPPPSSTYTYSSQDAQSTGKAQATQNAQRVGYQTAAASSDENLLTLAGGADSHGLPPPQAVDTETVDSAICNFYLMIDNGMPDIMEFATVYFAQNNEMRAAARMQRQANLIDKTNAELAGAAKQLEAAKERLIGATMSAVSKIGMGAATIVAAGASVKDVDAQNKAELKAVKLENQAKAAELRGPTVTVEGKANPVPQSGTKVDTLDTLDADQPGALTESPPTKLAPEADDIAPTAAEPNAAKLREQAQESRAEAALAHNRAQTTHSRITAFNSIGDSVGMVAQENMNYQAAITTREAADKNADAASHDSMMGMNQEVSNYHSESLTSTLQMVRSFSDSRANVTSKIMN